MMQRRLLGIALLLSIAVPVSAKGWDPVAPTVRAVLVNNENLISGLAPVYTDQSIEPQIELATGRRLTKSTKLGLSAVSTSRLMRRLPEANFTAFALGSVLRSGARQYTLEGEWTPHRDASPLAPGDEGGRYREFTGTAGYRQVVRQRLRLRFETTFGFKDYETLLDARDAHALEGYASAALSPQKGIDLRSELSTEWEAANAVKNNKRTAMVGVGLGIAPGAYKVDLRCRSVRKRYPDAVLGDSNNRRRDQRIELQLKTTRVMSKALSIYVQGEFANQTSSRLPDLVDVNGDGVNDHVRKFNFSTNTVLIGLEWSGGK